MNIHFKTRIQITNAGNGKVRFLIQSEAPPNIIPYACKYMLVIYQDDLMATKHNQVL